MGCGKRVLCSYCDSLVYKLLFGKKLLETMIMPECLAAKEIQLATSMLSCILSGQDWETIFNKSKDPNKGTIYLLIGICRVYLSTYGIIDEYRICIRNALATLPHFLLYEQSALAAEEVIFLLRYIPR